MPFVPYKITPYEGWEQAPCNWHHPGCNHLVYRKLPSCTHDVPGPLTPFALKWKLEEGPDINAFHTNPFTGKVFGAPYDGEYLTTEKFDNRVNQLYMAHIVSPNGSIICLARARLYFEEEEKPLGVIVFQDEKYMMPYAEDGERGFYVVFLSSSPIQSERLGVWHGDEDREGPQPWHRGEPWPDE